MKKQIKDVDLFETEPFRGFKAVGYYDYSHPWHWLSKCNYACFYLVVRGEICVFGKSGSTVAKEGDVLFLRSSDEVTMSCEEKTGNAYYFISFYYDESVDLMIDTVIKDAGVASLFKEIYEADRMVYALGKFKLYTLFIKLVYSLSSKTLKSDKEYSQTYHIRAAAEYINLNCTQSISTEDLCRISGYSPAHLRRLFAKHYGCSPHEYILDRRIDAAKEMLSDMPSKSIEEIADAAGFCSPSYFCKLFKKRVGTTPLEYKNKHGA